jgi:hypothetical protein
MHHRTETLVLGLSTLAVLAASAVTVIVSPFGAGHTSAPPAIYVNPVTGSDTAAGGAAAPLHTIQAALDRATPGVVIHLGAGTYREAPHTTVAGTSSAPITVEGPEHGYAATKRFRAVLYTTGHGFSVENSYYVLKGFTIDGQEALEADHPRSTWPRRFHRIDAFKDSVKGTTVDDRLVFIAAADGQPAVTGTVVNDMYLIGAGSECVHIREASTRSLITHSVIRYCGMHPKEHAGAFRYHNGEGVYIGTSPKSTTESMYADDRTANNRVVDTRIRTFGSECFDVKENAYGNALIDSVCADNTEPLQYGGSNVELRGYNNRIAGTTIRASSGDGVKIASDSPSYDRGGNSIVGDTFRGQAGMAITSRSHVAQGTICGNTDAGPRAVADPRWMAPCPTSG